MIKEINHLKPGIYFIDEFNLNPIFLIKHETSIYKTKNCFVRTWEEVLRLYGKINPENINFDYIASLISRIPKSNVSPYKNITRLPRSSVITINKDGSYSFKLRDPFSKKQNNLNSEDFEQKLRTIFFEDIKSIILEYDGYIGAELSGGLDSSFILGSLLKLASKKIKNRIHVFSYKFRNEEKAINMARDFYNLSNSNFHLIKLLTSDPNDVFKKLGYLPQIPYSIIETSFFTKYNCNVVLSGFGGDQCITNYGHNIPTDLLNTKRFKELFDWSGNKSKFLKNLIKRYSYFLFPNIINTRFNVHPKKFLATKILCSNLKKDMQNSLSPLLDDCHSWELDSFVDMKKSIVNRIMSDHLALRVEQESRIAEYCGVKKIFPLLNHNLIQFILDQDVLIFAKSSSKKRDLLPRVFADVLPNDLCLHPSKDFYSEDNFFRNPRDYYSFIEEFLNSFNYFHPYLRKIWHFDLLKEEIKEIYKNNLKNSPNLEQICQAISIMQKLNSWVLFLENN